MQFSEFANCLQHCLHPNVDVTPRLHGGVTKSWGFVFVSRHFLLIVILAYQEEEPSPTCYLSDIQVGGRRGVVYADRTARGSFLGDRRLGALLNRVSYSLDSSKGVT